MPHRVPKPLVRYKLTPGRCCGILVASQGVARHCFGKTTLITIYEHPVRAGSRSSRSFSIKNERITLAPLRNDDGAETDYVARIVRTRDLGMGYGRGVYTFDPLIQLPPEARDGDELFLVVNHDSQYHTHYHFELRPDDGGAVLRTYRLSGDHLQE